MHVESFVVCIVCKLAQDSGRFWGVTPLLAASNVFLITARVHQMIIYTNTAVECTNNNQAQLHTHVSVLYWSPDVWLGLKLLREWWRNFNVTPWGNRPILTYETVTCKVSEKETYSVWTYVYMSEVGVATDWFWLIDWLIGPFTRSARAHFTTRVGENKKSDRKYINFLSIVVATSRNMTWQVSREARFLLTSPTPKFCCALCASGWNPSFLNF